MGNFLGIVGTSGGGGSGGSAKLISTTISQVAHGLSVGDPVYFDDSSSTWKQAQSNSADTLATAVVSEVGSVDTFTLSFSGVVEGLTGVTDDEGAALVAGTFYYVSETTAGSWTDTEPANPNFSNPLIQALSADKVVVLGYRASGVELVEGWDDLRVADTQFDLANVNPPEPKILLTTGASSSGYGINLETYTATASIFAPIADYSMAFWLKLNDTPTGLAKTVFSGTHFEIRLNSSRELSFRVETSGGTEVHNFPTQLTVGAAYCIVWVLEDSGGDVISTVYVNDVSDQVAHSSVTLSHGPTNAITAGGTSGGRDPDVILDELRFWADGLSATEASNFYNEGAGTTGAVAAGDLVAGWHFDAGTGTTAENYDNPGTYDLTLDDASMWDEGLIDSASGIAALAFPPDRRTEFRVVTQLPHKYKEGSDIRPHIHYVIQEALGADTVKLTMQYAWFNVNDDIGNTTLVESTIDSNDFVSADINHHKVKDLGDIDGAGKKISSIFMALISRDGDSSEDDFDGDVFILEFDIHFLSDTGVGSTQEYIK